MTLLPNIETQLDINNLLQWGDDTGIYFYKVKTFSLPHVTLCRKPFFPLDQLLDSGVLIS